MRSVIASGILLDEPTGRLLKISKMVSNLSSERFPTDFLAFFRRSAGSLVVFLFAVFVPVILPLPGSAEEQRTWTSSEGKTLSGTLVHSKNGEVTLELPSGRETIFAIDRLSEKDRRYLQNLEKKGLARSFEPLPEETSLEDVIAVSGGPRVFRTSHFEFRTNRNVSPTFVSEASRVYEGTLAALRAIPHGLELSPPKDRTHFAGRFLDDQEFRKIADEKMGTLPGQRVIGLYLSDSQELLVPYSSLGAKQLGSRMTLRKSSDTSTLVHEIVHQVMHDWLPVYPTWFSEGLAEYVASVPNQNGRFSFRYAERGLKNRLEEQYGIEGRRITGVRRPSHYFSGLSKTAPLLTEMISGQPAEPVAAGLATADAKNQRSGGIDGFDPWDGRVDEYRDALLLFYFFMHLDQSDDPGKRVGQYLRSVDLALGDSKLIRDEVGAFEKRRLVYNEKVRAFNMSLGEFRKSVDAYNERVLQYNEQVKAGLPNDVRIEVGEIPQLPVTPERPEIPESIRLLIDERRSINLVALVQDRSLRVLLHDRTPQDLDVAMKQAYEAIGWDIRFD